MLHDCSMSTCRVHTVTTLDEFKSIVGFCLPPLDRVLDGVSQINRDPYPTLGPDGMVLVEWESLDLKAWQRCMAGRS